MAKYGTVVGYESDPSRPPYTLVSAIDNAYSKLPDGCEIISTTHCFNSQSDWNGDGTVTPVHSREVFTITYKLP